MKNIVVVFIFIFCFVFLTALYAFDQTSLWDVQLPKIQTLIKQQTEASDIEAEKLIEDLIAQNDDKKSKILAMHYMVQLLTNPEERFAEKYKDEGHKRAEKLLDEIIQHDAGTHYKYPAMLDYANMHRLGQTTLSKKSKINGFNEAERILKFLCEQNDHKSIKQKALEVLITMNLHRESEKARQNHIVGLKEAERFINILSEYNKYQSLCLRGLLHLAGNSKLYRENPNKALIEGKRLLNLVATQNEDQIYKKMAQYNLNHLDEIVVKK